MKRITLPLDDALLAEAKLEAQRRGETLTGLVEQGLRLVIAHRGRPATPRRPMPVSKATGGLQPGIDLNDMKTVWDRLDGID